MGLGLGHEILATIDNDWSKAMVLNPFYTSASNQFQSGSVAYPLSSLSVGRHTLTIKAWDMFNNSSETTITFYVFGQSTINVTHVYTFPNPLVEGTTFTFRPEPGNGKMNVEIEVFTITGQPVKLIDLTVAENYGQPIQVYWDGTNRNGLKLTSGIYPYTVKFIGENGSFTQTSNKVIVLR